MGAVLAQSTIGRFFCPKAHRSHYWPALVNTSRPVGIYRGLHDTGATSLSRSPVLCAGPIEVRLPPVNAIAVDSEPLGRIPAAASLRVTRNQNERRKANCITLGSPARELIVETLPELKVALGRENMAVFVRLKTSHRN